jgi:hypothetical protein
VVYSMVYSIGGLIWYYLAILHIRVTARHHQNMNVSFKIQISLLELSLGSESMMKITRAGLRHSKS